MTSGLTYGGKGKCQVAPDKSLFRKNPDADPPEGYIASDELAEAVNAAIFLGQPLLVTGEPGTGKTELASSIAWEFGLPLQEFRAKTSSTGGDLFYQFDSLLRFQDAHDKDRRLEPTRYVDYSALGKAILYSHPPEAVKAFLPEKSPQEHKAATRSVVLIDEIDKAPRDFPNDILQEIGRLSFRVKETGWAPFEVNRNLRPIVIVTSNLERNLPDAFLRRCVFFHILFPDLKQLHKIVELRLKPTDDRERKLYDAGVKRVDAIRSDPDLVKKPATAEMLAWLRVLNRDRLSAEDLSNPARLRSSYSVLMKTREDFDRMIGTAAGAGA